MQPQSAKRVVKALEKHTCKVRLAYPRAQSYSETNEIMKNTMVSAAVPPDFPFIVLDFIKIDEEIVGMPGEFTYLLLRTMNPDFRLNRKDTE